MAITINLATLASGTYTVEDDGIPGNGVSVVRDPLGNIVTTFFHPADALTILSRAGQNINVTIADSLTTADFTIGDLVDSSVRPDNINIGGVLTSGTVTLTANNTINELGSDAATDIVAGNLLLDARSGIGVGAGGAIETQVSFLEAESVAGGINLSNINNLQIGGITGELRGLLTGTSGHISLVNQGSIILGDTSGVESAHSAGNLALTAIGSSANISSNVNRDALLARGNISLTAGQDILFGTLGSDFDNDVRAGGSISVQAGRDFHIDGFSDMAADDQGLHSNGGVTITAGRDILIEDDNGVDASVGVTASSSTGMVKLTTGIGGTLSIAANSSAAIFAGLGGVTANADRILIEFDSGVSASGGNITLDSVSHGRPILLGSATDGVTAVEISDAELDRLFSPLVTIGGTAAPTGDINVVGPITHNTDTLSLYSDSAILDSLGLDAITVNSLALHAAAGIGSFNTLNTAVSTLAFANASGDVNISNHGALTLDAVDDLTCSFNAGGTTTITASSPLTVATDVVSAGALTLMAGKSGGTGDDLIIAAGVAIISGDAVVLSAGDNFTLEADAFILSGIQSISISVDAGNADAGIGGTADLRAGASGGPPSLTIVTGNSDGDTLLGGATNESLSGAAGNDRLAGGAGINLLNGGADNDTAYYLEAPSGVTANLAKGTAANGYGGSDALISIENVVGSSLSDALTGDSNANILVGKLGDDILRGAQGNDQLRGSQGHDEIHGGGGSDDLIGGVGNDTMWGGTAAATDLADRFWFDAGFGQDTINDFVATGAGADHLNFAGDVDFAIVGGTNTLISDGGGNTVLLTGVVFDNTIFAAVVSENGTAGLPPQPPQEYSLI